MLPLAERLSPFDAVCYYLPSFHLSAVGNGLLGTFAGDGDGRGSIAETDGFLQRLSFAQCHAECSAEGIASSSGIYGLSLEGGLCHNGYKKKNFLSSNPFAAWHQRAEYSAIL